MTIIDGHNLIGAGAALGLSLAQPDKEDRLLRLLVSHRARRRCGGGMLVVFDGHHGRLAVGPRRYRHGVLEVEVAVGETADAVILRRVRGAARPREVTVVTSDAALLREAVAAGARPLRSREFLAQLRVARGAEPEAPEKPDAPGPEEVADWLERFGGGR